MFKHQWNIKLKSETISQTCLYMLYCLLSSLYRVWAQDTLCLHSALLLSIKCSCIICLFTVNIQ